VKGTLLGLFLSAKGFSPNPEKGQVILEKKINDVEVTDEVEGETIPRQKHVDDRSSTERMEGFGCV